MPVDALVRSLQHEQIDDPEFATHRQQLIDRLAALPHNPNIDDPCICYRGKTACDAARDVQDRDCCQECLHGRDESGPSLAE